MLEILLSLFSDLTLGKKPSFFAFGLNMKRYGVSPYSVLMQENEDQKSSEYGLFLLSVSLLGELI